MPPFVRPLIFAATALALGLATPAAMALERLEFRVEGGDRALERRLRAASELLAAQRGNRTGALDLFADARAEYGRLLAALYAAGHYGPEIHVWIDGREASGIAPLDAPARIGVIEVSVDPGPAFRFGFANIAPLASQTELPAGFSLGKAADSGVILQAVEAAVEGWRARGHAKAAAGRQDLVADHANSTLKADIDMVPGPKLRFGPLTIDGTSRLRRDRAHAMAGLPVGAVFSPAELRRVAERLRRSGVFSSVSLTEADGITPPDRLAIHADVVEARTRRYSLGAELASTDGLVLSGSWLHRNLLGGAERLEISFEVQGIGAAIDSQGYSLGVTLDRPATPDPDTVLNLGLTLDQFNLADSQYRALDGTLGFTRYFSDTLQGHARLGYSLLVGSDPAGDFAYRTAELPLGLTWDRRNSKTDPTRLFIIDLSAKPFYGFGLTGNGLKLGFDARGYRSPAEGDRLVLALRLQGGAVLGADILDAPRDDLFLSGGGGTVRGQPYQSLGVTVSDGGTDVELGGTQFVAASLEARLKLGDRWGLAGFVDAAAVGDGTQGDWHAGAGLGLRYATGIGPVRLDIAMPIHGEGTGPQIYVGLGQAF